VGTDGGVPALEIELGAHCDGARGAGVRVIKAGAQPHNRESLGKECRTAPISRRFS
jgi:hypothetical protein